MAGTQIVDDPRIAIRRRQIIPRQQSGDQIAADSVRPSRRRKRFGRHRRRNRRRRRHRIPAPSRGSTANWHRPMDSDRARMKPVISKRIGMISKFGMRSNKAGTILPRHAVARVDDDLDRPLQRQKFHHVLAIRLPEISLFVAPVQACIPLSQRGGDPLDVVEPACRSDRPCPGPVDLKTVVLNRIVRSRRLNPADAIEVIDREIKHRRVDHSDVDDIESDRADALR